jgi:hypothetical protein
MISDGISQRDDDWMDLGRLGLSTSRSGSRRLEVLGERSESMGVLRGLLRAVGGLVAGLVGLLTGVVAGLLSLLRRLF